MNNLEILPTEEIRKLCEKNKMKSLFAFGLVTIKDFNEKSDVDLVVDFYENDPLSYTGFF